MPTTRAPDACEGDDSGDACHGRPAAAGTVQLCVAGSLKAALTDVGKAYEASTGSKVEAKYGPSGILKNEISGGAKADIFASAYLESGGIARREKERPGAALCAQQPQFIVLDEPTASLDFGNQEKVMNEIRALAKSGHGCCSRPMTRTMRCVRLTVLSCFETAHGSPTDRLRRF